jgi:hypothetical protein
MSNSTNNKCFNCGKEGHYVNECYKSSDNEEIYCCEYCDKDFDEEYDCIKHEKKCKYNNNNNNIICYRCGRDGHYASSCYATRHIIYN